MMEIPINCSISPNLEGLEEVNEVLSNKYRSASMGEMVKVLDKMIAKHGFTNIHDFVYKHAESGKHAEVCRLGASVRLVWIDEKDSA